MTSAQVVETSVTNNSSFQNYSHPDDRTIRTVSKLSEIIRAILNNVPIKTPVACSRRSVSKNKYEINIKIENGK